MSSIIVCGLGTLGQSCALKLKEFGSTVVGVEISENELWDLLGAPESFDRLVRGDCREPSVLDDAGITSARAILIVTGQERVNLAAMFAARALNPTIRIVVSSSQERLNKLLGAHLRDIVALDPTQIAAPAFALESLGDDVLGLFKVEGRPVRVTRRVIEAQSKWCGSALIQLETHHSRILTTSTAPASEGFAAWEPDAILQPGDSVTVVEADQGWDHAASVRAAAQSEGSKATRLRAFARALFNVRWGSASQPQRIASVCLAILGSLYLLGVLLYKEHYEDITLHDALNVSSVLILGGYDNLFGNLKLPFPIPPSLHVFSFLETIAGTIFIGIVYAFLTERVLSTRFQFRRRRPRVPKESHVVIVGLSAVGKQVARILLELNVPVVASDQDEAAAAALPDMPFVTASEAGGLVEMNVPTALSVMTLTDDDVANLELALFARSQSDSCALVIRTDDAHFSQSVSRLLPRAHALGVHDLAAEAFAAAAFGETILGLMRVDRQTTLVTEYRINTGDSLENSILAELKYGYGIMPLLHESDGKSEFMPGDERRLKAGDRLIALATVDGLQRVEQGSSRVPRWAIRVERALTKDAVFDGGMMIARNSRCSIEAARAAMNSLPCTIAYPLYKQQAQRLVRKLGRAQVEARVEPFPDDTASAAR